MCRVEQPGSAVLPPRQYNYPVNQHRQVLPTFDLSKDLLPEGSKFNVRQVYSIRQDVHVILSLEGEISIANQSAFKNAFAFS